MKIPKDISKETLIKLIEEYLQKSKYVRSDNYKSYTMIDLIKTCRVYNINYSDSI
jgi:hypothetical protein